MKSRLSSLFIVLITVFAMVAMSGCCRKPPEELDQAKAAVAQAKENCAEVYAKDEYMKAYNALSMAEKYGEDRKCKDSRKASLEAIELANEAEVRANEVKADLDGKAKEKMATIEGMMKKGQEEFAKLQAKKAEFDGKRSQALKTAEDKEFAKYDISMDLPTATIDSSIESDGQALMNEYQRIKGEYENGTCNLIEVNADLDKIPGRGQAIMNKMTANMKQFDERMARIDAIMEEKLAALVEAMKPKYMTEYKVVKGDTLWHIAEMELVYKNPFQWPLLWWENKWTEEKAVNMSKEARFNLIKDPDLIYPNQHLKIGQEMSQEEIDKAIHYAKNRYGKTDWRDIPDFLTDGK